MADPTDFEDEKPRCRLYLITPASLTCDADALRAFAEVMTAALDAGDVACIHLDFLKIIIYSRKQQPKITILCAVSDSDAFLALRLDDDTLQ